jgi:hypothetical protein
MKSTFPRSTCVNMTVSKTLIWRSTEHANTWKNTVIAKAKLMTISIRPSIGANQQCVKKIGRKTKFLTKSKANLNNSLTMVFTAVRRLG